MVKKSKKQQYLTYLLSLDILLGLVFAYYGIIFTFDSFVREGFISYIGVPGLIVSILSFFTLYSQSIRLKIAVALLSTLYFLTMGILITLLTI
jgi:hypothetical protein